MLVFSVASLVKISRKWVSNLLTSKFLSMRKVSFQDDCLPFSDIYQNNNKLVRQFPLNSVYKCPQLPTLVIGKLRSVHLHVYSTEVIHVCGFPPPFWQSKLFFRLKRSERFANKYIHSLKKGLTYLVCEHIISFKLCRHIILIVHYVEHRVLLLRV